MALEDRHLADYRTGDDLFTPATEDHDAPPADAYEQARPEDTPTSQPFEANEADAAEQARIVGNDDVPDEPHVSFEANEADAAEQARIVEGDDEYDR